jgi:hypothetical protein
MSYGHVAEIGAPAELIRRYECESLDQVFKVISAEQEWEEWYEEGEESTRASTVASATQDKATPARG